MVHAQLAEGWAAGALYRPLARLEFLPATDRSLFLDEFTRVVTAATAVDNYEPLTQVVREWRATAEVHADPKLARRLRKPLDASGERVARSAG